MFQVLNHNEVAFTGEFSQSPNDFIEDDYVNLDDVIRLNEDRQSGVESGYSDFCKPVEDWLLD